MDPKSGTFFHFMSRLVKILEAFKTLLKTGMVLDVIAWCARVDLE